MARGDYDWAVEELSDALGAKWDLDRFGHTLLHMGLYEGSNTDVGLAPDLQHGAYEGFLAYMTDTYDYDFEEEFDWDAYRAWYDD